MEISTQMTPEELWDEFFYGTCPSDCVPVAMFDKIAGYLEAQSDSVGSEIEAELEAFVWHMLESSADAGLLVVEDLPDFVPGRLVGYMFEHLKEHAD
jgi:hypothetical protein